MAKVKVFGNLFKSGKEAREIFGISYSATNKLMHTNNLTQSEALERLVPGERFAKFKTAEVIKGISDNLLAGLSASEQEYLNGESKTKKVIVHRRYSALELKFMIAEYKKGTPIKAIAGVIGRTPAAVSAKIHQMKEKGDI